MSGGPVASSVELIVGPARSGKGRYVLTAYRDALAEAGPRRALMLVPTGARRRETETRLLATQATGVLVQPQVFTLPVLADRLLTAAGSPVRRITELARRQVIRECLGALGGRDAALLGHVRTMPGLLGALDELFRELKAARVEPDAFGRAIRGHLGSPQNRLIARLYDAYQKALHSRDVYDDAGQFWHAAALVADGEFGPFSPLALLVADGFQDFAPAQLDMLEALSRRAERTLITLTWEPDRPNLFGVTGRTRERLRRRFGERLKETVLDEPSDGPADLERVRRCLFHLSDAATPPPAAGDVSVIRAAGRTREVEAVARRCVDLVRGGATEPGSIAVLARSLEGYATLVREVFPRYGLAFRVQKGLALSDCPVVRAAMALVRLQVEDYSFRSVARLLRSNYFVPAAFGADGDTARAAVRLARDAGVFKSRHAYAKGLDYLRSRLKAESAAVDDSGDPVLAPDHKAERAAEIDRAEGLLRTLFDRLALPAEATRRAFADALREMLRQAGIWDAARADPKLRRRARDLKALAALEDVLEEVALLDDPDGSKVPLAEFLDEVTHGLGLASVAAAEPPDAPVVVLDVYGSRALSFEHVFVMGLSEKAFPRRGRRHPFFDDAERDDLRRRGVDLADTSHAAQQEMFLFYLAATRARQTLALSYPALDSRGRATLASHYLDELTSLFAPGPDGEPLPVTDVGTRDLDLPLEQVRADRELLAQTMASLWGPRHGGHIDADLAVLAELLTRGPAAETALAGLAAEWEREHGDAFGPFDGCLDAETIVEELCRRFPGETAMSARRLEAFGACPFAYLAGEVLGLRPVDEPSPDLGPMDLGLICHSLLERFFTAAAASKTLAGQVTDETLEAALALLEKTAGGYFKDLEKGARLGSPALWKVQKRNILRDVRGLLRWHARSLAGWRAAHAEVAFGCGGHEVEPPGRAEPIRLDTPHGDLRLRGRIDRIDLATDGDGYQIIDYKSGASAPTASAMEAGTSFQLPLYLRAAAELLHGMAGDGRAEAFFLPVRKPRRTGRLANTTSKGEPDPSFDAALDRAAEYIRRFVEAMRLGRYPVYPRTGCPGHCDFSGICRFAEWRVQRKWEANPIPELACLTDAADDGGEADP